MIELNLQILSLFLSWNSFSSVLSGKRLFFFFNSFLCFLYCFGLIIMNWFCSHNILISPSILKDNAAEYNTLTFWPWDILPLAFLTFKNADETGDRGTDGVTGLSSELLRGRRKWISVMPALSTEWVPGQPGLHSETWLENTKQTNKKEYWWDVCCYSVPVHGQIGFLPTAFNIYSSFYNF